MRIEVNGEIDHLNACLGLCKATLDLPEPFESIQRELMTIMAYVAQGNAAGGDDGRPKELVARLTAMLATAISRMEEYIRESADGSPFGFVLPGKSMSDAVLHLARTQTRTCERRWVTLKSKLVGEDGGASPALEVASQIGVYLNRLSDFLFCMSQRQG